MKKSSAEKLRLKGEGLRENEHYLEALQVLDEALLTAQKENAYGVMVDVLKDRCLTWKHLFLLTKDKAFFVFAKKDSEAMLALSETMKLKDKFGTSYFRLGEVAMLVENFDAAVSHFQKSLRGFSGELARKGNYRIHLGEALYRSGKKEEGKREMLKGIEEIRRGVSTVDPFYIHVWESGAHLRLVELLHREYPEEAETHLTQAKKIVDSDKRLVIRRRQVRDLAKRLTG